MKNWKPDRQGINFALDGKKFEALHSALTLLQTLAEDEGHENIKAWALDNFEDLDSIAEEHGAKVRKTGKFVNMEWRTKVDDTHQMRCGLTFVTKKGKRLPSSVLFFARAFWVGESE